MTTLEVANTKNDHVARTFRTIKADATGTLPTRIEVLKIGMWDTPYHGMFMITPEDIAEMITNFEAGVGLPGQGAVGAPIDFGHDSDDEAAGWITGLATDANTLYADVEWTDAGKTALTGGNFKCFSPEFYPGSRGGWEDPEQYGVYIPNVLVGGGLTNIPLFKDLKPVMASKNNGSNERDRDNVIFISASIKEKSMPTLEEVRTKKNEELTEEEKTFVAEHKAELSQEEQTKFGLEVTPAAPAADPVADPVADPAPAPDNGDSGVAASLKSGESVVIKATDLKALQDSSREYQTEKAEQVVKTHIMRGAIKADSLERWTKQVMADREGSEALLNSIPDNQLLKDELGTEHGDEEIDERDRIMILAKAKVEASEGKAMKIEDAVKAASAEIRASQSKQ